MTASPTQGFELMWKLLTDTHSQGTLLLLGSTVTCSGCHICWQRQFLFPMRRFSKHALEDLRAQGVIVMGELRAKSPLAESAAKTAWALPASCAT